MPTRNNTRLAFLHTIDPGSVSGEWRVFPAFILHESLQLVLDKHRKTARLLFLDSTGGVRICDEQHFDDRTSASYWVNWDEARTMYEDIDADWKKRRLWRKALEDAIECAAMTSVAVSRRRDC